MSLAETKAQHTPGPWRWQFIGTAGNYHLLAGDEYAPSWVEVGGPPREELSPDQHLIQTAPELLAALQMWIDWYEGRTYATIDIPHIAEKSIAARDRAIGEA